MNTLLFKDHAELRLRFFILSISCSRLKASRVCIKGCNIFLHSQTPPSLPKVFLLDLLGSHLAKFGLTTRAGKLLTICYADFFLYSKGGNTQHFSCKGSRLWEQAENFLRNYFYVTEEEKMNTKQHINQRLTEIKTNLTNWEKWFAVKVYDQHKCAASGERDDTAVLYVSSPDTDLKPDWAMARIWLAGAEEVRNGDASAVGDSMNLSLIAINYCPFCGQKLQSTDNAT